MGRFLLEILSYFLGFFKARSNAYVVLFTLDGQWDMSLANLVVKDTHFGPNLNAQLSPSGR
jgi:hypothetical protein